MEATKVETLRDLFMDHAEDDEASIPEIAAALVAIINEYAVDMSVDDEKAFRERIILGSLPSDRLIDAMTAAEKPN